MKRLPLVLLAAVLGCAWVGCGKVPPNPPANAALLRVAAASDLQFALEEIIRDFEQNLPSVKVKPTYGSSGNLFAQLQQGAPFDVFLSADVKLPRLLERSGRAEAGSTFIYGIGRIAVWVPSASPINVEAEGVRALLHPSVRKIAIANPAHAPYGAAAEAALKHFGLYDQLAGSLVLGENVVQAAQFIESGAAEIGVIAFSLATSPKLRAAGRFWLVPLEAFPRLEQGGVVISGSRQTESARRFAASLTEPSGRAILERHGFLLPRE
jgi:molybdate transport system substrate-binding protein